MIKCFEQGYKINYVDHNNKFVGFDMQSNCCEDFGSGIFDHIPEKGSAELDNPDLETYYFEGTAPMDCMDGGGDGGGLAFRIISPTLPPLYVAIWNHHNGYYSHGFESYAGGGSL
jgi:hypothetical protein